MCVCVCVGAVAAGNSAAPPPPVRSPALSLSSMSARRIRSSRGYRQIKANGASLNRVTGRISHITLYGRSLNINGEFNKHFYLTKSRTFTHVIVETFLTGFGWEEENRIVPESL